MQQYDFKVKGLSSEEVQRSREQFGANEREYKKENRFFAALKSLAKEPMVLLLLAASFIYFLSGDTADGIFMAAAIILVATISLYQDFRSRNALEKLKAFSQPTSKVIRDGAILEIKSGEVVVGDSTVLEEGTLVSADGKIIQSHDFSVNESLLTGESFAVAKDASSEDHFVYAGTMVVSGLAIAEITQIGKQTRLGKIGSSLEGITEEKTPLERQIGHFVRKMVLVGAVVFVMVWGINFMQSHDWLDSLTKSLTLAMSILPEEIPVAFTTFMALGAWRLMKMGIVVRQMKTVETLGSATVICTDKTGTLTENKMTLARVYAMGSKRISRTEDPLNEEENDLIRWAMWASEPFPFDPMEISVHARYGQSAVNDERPDYTMIPEYPLEGKPPMMTHVLKTGPE